MKRFAQWFLGIVVAIFVLTEIFIEESPKTENEASDSVAVAESFEGNSKLPAEEVLYVEPVVENYDPKKMVEDLKSSLSLWEPESLNYSDNIVTIVSKDKRITSQIYHAMVHAVCGSAWSNEELWKGSQIKEVRILNRFEKQGWVFEGGLPECKKLGELTSDESRPYVSGITHLF